MDAEEMCLTSQARLDPVDPVRVAISVNHCGRISHSPASALRISPNPHFIFCSQRTASSSARKNKASLKSHRVELLLPSQHGAGSSVTPKDTGFLKKELFPSCLPCTGVVPNQHCSVVNPGVLLLLFIVWLLENDTFINTRLTVTIEFSINVTEVFHILWAASGGLELCSSQHPPAAARGGIPHGFLTSGGSFTVLYLGRNHRDNENKINNGACWGRAQWLEGWELHQLWGAEGNLPKGELPGPTFVTKTELWSY